MLPNSPFETNPIALVAGPEWTPRSFSTPGVDGLVLTPTQAFKAELLAKNSGRDPVYSISVQLLRDCSTSLPSLLDAEVARHKKLDPEVTIESRQCEPSAPECSCLMHYRLLYPLNTPHAERLTFSLLCILSKCHAGVLRYDVRARDFYMEQAISAASAIFRTVVVKQ